MGHVDISPPIGPQQAPAPHPVAPHPVAPHPVAPHPVAVVGDGPPPDPNGMETDGLAAELVAHATWETIGLARMLDVLAEFDRRSAWSTWIGCTSIQQWLSWKCGLGYTAATERLRVARALPKLPTIAARFREGVLSWSKVRELTRVATPQNEAMWAELAAMMTAAQVSRITAAERRVSGRDVHEQHERRDFTHRIDDHGAVVITWRLPADEAAPVLAAVRAATPPERGRPYGPRAAERAAELLLGRAQVRTEVHVQVEQCPSCQDERARTADGLPLHPQVADTLACVADLVVTSDSADSRDAEPSHAHADEPAPNPGSDGEPTDLIERDRRRGPTKRQRRWLRRRHPTCQFPGCHHTGRLDTHHVHEHGAGGRTRIPNLAVLCRFHHRVVHLHGLVLTLHSDRTLTVTTAAGRSIDHPILRAALRLPPPEDSSRIGGLAEPMDLDACLLAVHLCDAPVTAHAMAA